MYFKLSINIETLLSFSTTVHHFQCLTRMAGCATWPNPGTFASHLVGKATQVMLSTRMIVFKPVRRLQLEYFYCIDVSKSVTPELVCWTRALRSKLWRLWPKSSTATMSRWVKCQRLALTIKIVVGTGHSASFCNALRSRTPEFPDFQEMLILATLIRIKLQ